MLLRIWIRLKAVGSDPVRRIGSGINHLKSRYANAAFRIRIGFNADPDPAFYLEVDPGSQTNADPCGSGSW